jgi:hypothetical protein
MPLAPGERASFPAFAVMALSASHIESPGSVFFESALALSDNEKEISSTFGDGPIGPINLATGF